MNVKEYLTSKKYGSLRYKLSYFFIVKFFPGWNEYRNPWYHWWKARKYFKRPTFYLERTFGLPIRRDYYSPVIGFHALGWKDKWGPMICITFSELGIYYGYLTGLLNIKRIVLLATWEAILDYTRYDKSLSYVVNNHIW